VTLDSHYVSNWSLPGDLLILLRTVKVVFSQSGSY
jgi:lipopolysaccharide/colanic/teichoic acid biosynthesis glycosyltransferase